MHDEIIKYTLTGVVDESNVPKHKEELIKFLDDVMRGEGMVPSLDLDPQFTLRYDPDIEAREFVLSIYGVYIGKDKAWDIAGVTNGVSMRK